MHTLKYNLKVLVEINRLLKILPRFLNLEKQIRSLPENLFLEFLFKLLFLQLEVNIVK